MNAKNKLEIQNKVPSGSPGSMDRNQNIKGAVRGILAITPIFVLYEALKRKKYNGAIGKCLKSQY